MFWNDVLTDDDGQYVELMFGAFSDNQPDYSWLHPYETKESKMYLMPFRDVSSVKKVNKNGILNLSTQKNEIVLGAYATSNISEGEIILARDDKIIFIDKISLKPEKSYFKKIINSENTSGIYKLSLLSSKQDTLIQYIQKDKVQRSIPQIVTNPLAVEDINSPDSLFYVGLRLEQFHEPQIDYMDYYFKAIEIDSNHVKSNLRIGINFFQRGLYDEAEIFFEKVIDRITYDYTIAEDAEAIYWAGLTQLRKENYKKAYKLLYRSSWDYEWFSPAQYQLALIKLHYKDLRGALYHLDESLSANQRNIQALATKSTVLRKLNKYEMSRDICNQILKINPLSLRAHLKLPN